MPKKTLKITKNTIDARKCNVLTVLESIKSIIFMYLMQKMDKKLYYKAILLNKYPFSRDFKGSKYQKYSKLQKYSFQCKKHFTIFGNIN